MRAVIGDLHASLAVAAHLSALTCLYQTHTKIVGDEEVGSMGPGGGGGTMSLTSLAAQQYETVISLVESMM